MEYLVNYRNVTDYELQTVDTLFFLVFVATAKPNL